jgi:hypothetical protein
MIDLVVQKGSGRRGTYGISINGLAIPGVFAIARELTEPFGNGKPIIAKASFPPEAFRAIETIVISDLLEHAEEFTIYLPNRDASIDPGDWWFFSMRITAENEVGCGVTFNQEHWNRPYSTTELANCFKSQLDEFRSDLRFLKNKPVSVNGFGVVISFPDQVKIGDMRVGELLAKIEPELETVSFRVRNSLENTRTETLTTQFDFPEEVRPACEQYLLYFGQFLRDLGIDAETQITERASKVLFTIKPNNQEQALDTIREALSCYLQIPSSPDAENALARSSDIAMIQLGANLMHLKSQVMLATAIVQAKDATISAKDAEIANLKDALDLRTFARSLPAPSSADSEQIIEGVLAVKKMEYKGLELNTPEILRRLKRFRKK